MLPPPEPSSRPAAEEEDTTLRNSPAPLDWSSSRADDPLPAIDFKADTHSSAASVYAPGNAMEDDPDVPVAVSSLRDPDVGPLPLSPSVSISPPHVEVSPPQSEVKQLSDLIITKMTSLEREVSRIAGIVDGKAVTDLQGPPSERTQTEKLRDLKTLAQQYAHDQGSCDDTRISYLEFLESEVEDDLTLARMIAG
jgi:hypothetical protein